MFFFKDRKRIDELFKKWCEENEGSYCSYNMICFLQAEGLLNIEKCKEFISKEEMNDDDEG